MASVRSAAVSPHSFALRISSPRFRIHEPRDLLVYDRTNRRAGLLLLRFLVYFQRDGTRVGDIDALPRALGLGLVPFDELLHLHDGRLELGFIIFIRPRLAFPAFQFLELLLQLFKPLRGLGQIFFANFFELAHVAVGVGAAAGVGRAGKERVDHGL